MLFFFSAYKVMPLARARISPPRKNMHPKTSRDTDSHALNLAIHISRAVLKLLPVIAKSFLDTTAASFPLPKTNPLC